MNLDRIIFVYHKNRKMNTPIDFENAKLLKEKGFDIPVTHNYGKKGELGHIIDLGLDFEDVDNNRKENFNRFVGTYRQVSAPTIADVVMWLYEKHGMWIYVFKDYDLPKFNYAIQRPNVYSILTHLDNTFISSTDAYNDGIKYTLEKLLK
jgi:hypothetical protein